jgi:hypothetical protein
MSVTLQLNDCQLLYVLPLVDQSPETEFINETGNLLHLPIVTSFETALDSLILEDVLSKLSKSGEVVFVAAC